MIFNLFLISATLGIFFFIISSFLFEKAQIVDKPDNKLKKHKKNVPYNGGCVLFLIFSIFFLYFEKNFDFNFSNLQKYIFYFVILLIFLIGFLDDIFKLSPNLRFILLIVITIFFLKNFDQFILQNLNLSFNLRGPIGFAGYGIVITTICILAFIQASNMIDGINCQFAIYISVLIIYIYQQSNNSIIYLLPCLIIFIVLNFYNKSFIGDGGSYFLSFLVGLLFIDLYNKNLIFSDEVFIAMSYPGYDMIRLFIKRLKNKKNPFLGDRDHIHHLISFRYGEMKGIILSPIFLSFPIIASFFISNNFYNIIFTLIIYIIIILYLHKN